LRKPGGHPGRGRVTVPVPTLFLPLALVDVFVVVLDDTAVHVARLARHHPPRASVNFRVDAGKQSLHRRRRRRRRVRQEQVAAAFTEAEQDTPLSCRQVGVRLIVREGAFQSAMV
jgi:hypothetical protein